MSLISIIVPIYNVEPYIYQCIDSIINQTYTNLEIILVDDGSPDNCGKICDEYAKKDGRIKVIHKPNGGLSDARNAGIGIATGDYISFVDSDDFIHPQFIEILLAQALSNNADVSFCDFIRFDREILPKIHISSTEKKAAFTNKSFLDTLYDFQDWYPKNVVVWNKLYKRHLFDRIHFEIGYIHEDELIFTDIYTQGTFKIIYIDEKLYFYRQVENSIMNKAISIKRICALKKITEKRIIFFNEKKDLTNVINKYLYYIKELLKDSSLKKFIIIDKKAIIKIIKSKVNWILKIYLIITLLKLKINGK